MGKSRLGHRHVERQLIASRRNVFAVPAVHIYGVGYRTDGNDMSRQDNYRKSAAETVDLAHRVTIPADKAHLVALAERWLDLADSVAKRAKRQARDAQEWAAKHKSAA
jgi:hypothetical protein